MYKLNSKLSSFLLCIITSTFLLSNAQAENINTSVSVNNITLPLIYTNEEQPTEKKAITQLLQFQLQKKGIKLNLEPQANTIYYDKLGKKDFDSTISYWYLDYNDPEGFLTDFYSKAGFRLSSYNNPKFDKAYLAGLYAPNESEKTNQFKKALNILKEDLPWIPLFSTYELFLIKPEAKDFQSNAFQYYDYRNVKLKNIRIATDTKEQTLDPAQTYDLTSKHIVTQSYEGLVSMDKNSKIIPSLATEWKFSDKMDKLTFKLRAGTKFHNAPFLKNRDFNSEDVKFSFERMIKSNSPYTYIFDYVKGIEDFKSGKTTHVKGFSTPSSLTFVLDLKRPFPTMLPWLLAPAAYILPKELPGKYDFSKGSVGTGPFILKSWDGTTANFIKNNNYWLKDNKGNSLPLADSLSLRIMKDVNMMWTAFQQDELDMLNIPLALFNQVFTSDGRLKPEYQEKYAYREIPLNNLHFIGFNMNSKICGKNPKLRHQILNSIDKNEIVKKLYRGKARIANTVIPVGIKGFEK